MVGAAVKGVSKILRKGLKKSPVLGKRVRGTPTKAGLMARRGMLRGEKTMKDPSRLKQIKKDPLIGKTEKGIGIGVAGTLAYQEIKKGQKAAKAKENEKLKKSIEKHREKDKKKKEKHHSR